MALDGLGLVYEKQGNTGAAAYNNPVMEIGKNPLDYLAAQIREEGDVARKEKALKGKERDEANKKALFDLDISGSDYDNRAIFIQEANDLRKRGAELAMAGKDLRDYSDPDVLEWRRSIDRSSKAAGASLSQEKDFLTIRDEVAKNPENFDVDATMNALNAWYKMKPSERIDINPQDLKVRKYSALEPLDDIDFGALVSTSGYTGTESYSKVSKVDEKKLKERINSLVDSGKFDSNYESNKESMGWKTKEDYKAYLFKDGKNRVAKDVESGVIKQPAQSFTGLSPEERINAVIQSKPLDINLAVIDSSGQTMKDSSGKVKTKTYQLENSQGVSGIDVVVPGAQIVDATTNQKGIGGNVATNYTISGGNVGWALVGRDGRVIGDKKATHVYINDANGKLIRKTLRQAIIDGDAKFDVVLQSNSTETGTSGSETKVHPSYVLAETVITPDFASKSDSHNDAYLKTQTQKQLAEKENNRIKFGY